ncbi:MAG: ArsR family transcriptional regulator [Halobacteria archaeon]
MANPVVKDSRLEILKLLRSEGLGVEDLSQRLSMSKTAIRQHLAILEADGLVKKAPLRKGMGRPRILYSITDRGEATFPKQYSLVAELLLEELLENGKQAKEITDSIAARFAQRYGPEVASMGLRDRVSLFARILNEMGVEASMEETDGEFLVKEMSCPYHDVMRKFPLICRFDEGFFRNVVGRPVALESRAYGKQNFCTYVVKK